MDEKQTFHCPFLSIDYIVCECGESFSDEDALKAHLENGDHLEGLNVQQVEDNVAANVVVYTHQKSETKIKEEILQEENQEESEEDEEMVLSYEDDGKIVYTMPAQSKNEDTYVVSPKVEAQEISYYEFHEREEPDSAAEATEPRLDDDATRALVINQLDLEHNYKKDLTVKMKLEQFYFCDVCGKAFGNKGSLAIHMRKMHGRGPPAPQTRPRPRPRPANNKTAVCELCGKNYASQAALRYHQRVHTGERPYACTECPKRFTMPLFLQIHLRIHTGERPYACETCPKAFSNKAALLRHNRVHTGDKPYPCPECGKAFTQSNSMKLHVRTVHRKLPAPYKSKARQLRALLRRRQENGVDLSPYPVAEVPSEQVEIELYEVEPSELIEGQDYQMCYEDGEDM